MGVHSNYRRLLTGTAYKNTSTWQLSHQWTLGLSLDQTSCTYGRYKVIWCGWLGDGLVDIIYRKERNIFTVVTHHGCIIEYLTVGIGGHVYTDSLPSLVAMNTSQRRRGDAQLNM